MSWCIAPNTAIRRLDAVRLLWPSLAMGGLTTVMGYAALGMTGFPGFEQIAVFALFSIAASLALTRWVLPALLAKSNLHAAHLPGIAAWVDFCGRHRKVLLSLFAVGVMLAGLYLAADCAGWTTCRNWRWIWIS